MNGYLAIAIYMAFLVGVAVLEAMRTKNDLD